MSFPHAYGALLGVLCADAAGATLELSRVPITREMARAAMRMPGGGIWRVGRGQTTDDSELALSLARALVDHTPSDKLPLDAIAAQYNDWWRSKPCDIGNTCRNAFAIEDVASGEGLGATMVQRSALKNAGSEANGSLMRIAPLAIWGSKLQDEQLVRAARQEATLSHPHQVCQDCNAVYSIMVAHLIQHPGDREGALQKAETFVRQDHVHASVRDWVLHDSLDASLLNCLKAKGHARWGIALAVYHLRQNSSYEVAIEETLLKGGDTDTNAAIVGGLIGALHGADGIPQYMKDPVLAFDCSSPWSQGRKRPATYRSAQAEGLTRQLLQRSAEAHQLPNTVPQLSLASAPFSMSFPHAFGAFLGVLCADAAGATLEFSRVAITRDMARAAMRMPGGGIWRVGPGQITDDSELALSLARALVGHTPRDTLPLDAVAQKYHEWWSSNPYDIGNTCRSAFGIQDAEKTAAPLGATMVLRSAQWNVDSQANGSLMRILPLAIWASKLPDEQLIQAARQEATLSHPHQVCQDCNAAYCLMVAHLIQHPGDREGALKKAKAFVQRSDVHATVREWFLSESLDAAPLNCTKAIGHVRWAFALAVYHLRQNSSYETAIEETLLKGGDTDTNAAIVGGLMGALHGVDAIPAYMKEPVLAFNCSAPSRGQKRPAAYRSAQVEQLTHELLEQAERRSA